MSRAAAAYDRQEKDLITKTRKLIAASNRTLREAEAISEAPLNLIRLRFALLKSRSLAVHRFHMFSQCPPVLRQIEV